MTNRSGGHCWYELMTSDVEGAVAFYGNVLGWNLVHSGMPGMTYTLADVGTSSVAGLMAMPQEARETGAEPSWFGYVAVPDVDAHAERVKRAGGTVHRAPADIPGIGRFAIVADPQGAVFVLFTPAGTPPDPLPFGTPGTFGWHELHAKDWERVFDFYSGLFGWRKTEPMPMGGMGTYQLIGMDGANFGAMFSDPEAERPFWLYYASVEDIDAAAGRVAEAGGAVTRGPVEVPNDMWIVHVRDPQGAKIALVGPRGTT